jgi:hypothetical protein
MNWRSRLQFLLLLPLWLLFARGWIHILADWPRADLWASVRLLAGAAALYGLLLLLWIRHNLKLHRRKRPRVTAASAPAGFSRDILGRPLLPAQPAVFQAQYVVVEICEGRKIYRPASGLQEKLRDFEHAGTRADH